MSRRRKNDKASATIKKRTLNICKPIATLLTLNKVYGVYLCVSGYCKTNPNAVMDNRIESININFRDSETCSQF